MIHTPCQQICATEIQVLYFITFIQYLAPQIMLQIFKPKEQRKVVSILNQTGFFNQDFKVFRIGQIISKLQNGYLQFQMLLKVINQIKLTPLKSLKIALLLWLCVSSSELVKRHQQIFECLQQLNIRTRILLRVFKQKGASHLLNEFDEPGDTSKQLVNQKAEYICQNSSEIFLAKIVQPLIYVQEKIIVSYDSVWETSDLEKGQMWSELNLMKKIVEIGPDIEWMGRYYFRQSATAIICTIKIIDFDIQKLYKKIVQFIRRRMVEIQVLLEEQSLQTVEQVNSQRVEELIMFIEEVQIVNEGLRLLYNGKYFTGHFTANKIFIPILYESQHDQNLLVQISRESLIKQNKNRPLNNSVRRRKRRQIEQCSQDV